MASIEIYWCRTIYFKSQTSLTFQPLTFDPLDICPYGFRLMDVFFLPPRQLLVSVYSVWYENPYQSVEPCLRKLVQTGHLALFLAAVALMLMHFMKLAVLNCFEYALERVALDVTFLNIVFVFLYSFLKIWIKVSCQHRLALSNPQFNILYFHTTMKTTQ